jgi:hypothetical protein
VARRHPDVHDDKVGPPLPNQLDELRGIAALAYDVKAGALEQARQALAEQDVVVRKRNPGAVHGHYHDYRPALPFPAIAPRDGAGRDACFVVQ